MPREGYVNFRVTDANGPMLDALCRHLLADPSSHGARVDALNFGLRYTCAELRLAEEPGTLGHDLPSDAQGDEGDE
jgi:hypothetical protein